MDVWFSVSGGRNLLERNDVIHTIYEADLSVKAVYNRFFETDSCILYVVDAQERFTGVITSGIFGRGGYRRSGKIVP